MPILEILPRPELSGTREIRLSPAQETALRGVLLGLERGRVVVLRDASSDGKTTVLNQVHASMGGALVGMPEVLSRLGLRTEVSVEGAFVEVVEEGLTGGDLVIVDDLNRIRDIAQNCNNPRAELFEAALAVILAKAEEEGKKLLFATDYAPAPVVHRAHTWVIEDLQAADYGAIWSAYLEGTVLRRMDFVEIHRFTPSLNAHQLRKAAEWLAHDPTADTASALDYLSEHNLESNVEIGDVEVVELQHLKGVDDVIRELEAKVALPLGDRSLAAKLNLKPKRGVLLAGPPGTGKTTIGRALAHRLKGKFFLIDGTVIAGSRDFYSKIDQVFEAARRNAPAVVFIDDADVIFEGEDGDRGLYRYLLTKLDGLENPGAGRVCVMMTAMQPSSLPAAILRSGRIEVWLETRLPDEAARAEILRASLADLPEPLASVNVETLAQLTRGLTGADLKAAVEDTKLLFAHDTSAGRAAKDPAKYFRDAVETLRKHRRAYGRKKRFEFGESAPVGFLCEPR